jgi:hypothetical protein
MPVTAPWHLGEKSLKNAQDSLSGAGTWVDEKLEETNVVIVTACDINPRCMRSFRDRIADAI